MQTGVKVRVDAENWDDIRPKAAVAANVGAGPDIIMGTNDDPFKFPDKLLDVTDRRRVSRRQIRRLVSGRQNLRHAGQEMDRAAAGRHRRHLNYRISAMRAAGFDEFPKDLAGYLKLCQGLKRVGKPPGFALGHATGDANGWVHWCLWAHGGKMVDDNNNVAIDSPETIAALEYAKQLYATFIDGVLSWNDPSNNKAFLADQIGLTLNGISIYTVAKNSPEPALQAIAKDMDHANMPIGRSGSPTEAAEHPQHLCLRLQQISERGARISALHVGEAAGGRAGRRRRTAISRRRCRRGTTTRSGRPTRRSRRSATC